MEGSGATGIQVGAVIRMQHLNEVGALLLSKKGGGENQERDRERESARARESVCVSYFLSKHKDSVSVQGLIREICPIGVLAK